jgi:hypothetical protein
VTHSHLAQAWAHLYEAAKAARLEGVDEATIAAIERTVAHVDALHGRVIDEQAERRAA